MKTWRERIAEARVRGQYTEDDQHAWQNPQTCLVGEALIGAYGEFSSLKWMTLDTRLNTHVRDYQCEAIHSLGSAFNPARTEQLLEMAEDEAMLMKRGL